MAHDVVAVLVLDAAVHQLGSIDLRRLDRVKDIALAVHFHLFARDARRAEYACAAAAVSVERKKLVDYILKLYIRSVSNLDFFLSFR